MDGYGPSPSISQHIPDQSEAPEAPEAPTNAAQKVCVGSAVVPWPRSTSTGPRVSPSATESRFFLGAATQLATQDISQFYNKTVFCVFIDKYEIICIWLSTSYCFRIFSICFHSCSMFHKLPFLNGSCSHDETEMLTKCWKPGTNITNMKCMRETSSTLPTNIGNVWLSALGRGLSCS